MAHNTEELVRTAAALRAVGLPWSLVAEKLSRSRWTVMKWPRVFEAFWQKHFEEATRHFHEEYGAEAIAVLRANFKSDSEAVQLKAVELTLKYLHRDPDPPAADEPFGPRDKEIDDVDDRAARAAKLEWMTKRTTEFFKNVPGASVEQVADLSVKPKLQLNLSLPFSSMPPVRDTRITLRPTFGGAVAVVLALAAFWAGWQADGSRPFFFTAPATGVVFSSRDPGTGPGREFVSMSNCPQCGASRKSDNEACPVCGARAAVDGLDMPTFRYQGPLLGTRGPGRQVTPLARLFETKKSIVIGRYADCDICLSHPMISRWHALLERLPDGGLQVTDLGSINGVTINGRRIAGATAVAAGTPFAIGPFLFSAVDGHLRTIDSSQSIRLEARHVEKVVTQKDGTKRKLLDDVNLVIEPGEFVALLGPSGSGKSTLMDTLNGRRWATGGKVLANNEDFYRFFDSFRQSLGYVPQKDIVHTELTVMRALYYTARLRLPPDTDRHELEDRLFEVMRLMELQPHRDTLVGNLSGGQVKRVSLGAELLARPCMLYIDEATSGLDAGTEARMMRLFRKLADEGKSLVCITHNVENVDACHLALILARGKLIYYGPPADAPGFFGVSRITEIYDKIGEREPAVWEKQFRASEFHQEFVERRQTPDSPTTMEPTRLIVRTERSGQSPKVDPMVVEAAAATFRPKHPPILQQFRVLTARYAELIRSDPRTLRLLFLQAPIVAVILIIGFADKPYTRTQPRLRHLTKPEKDILLVLRAIEEDADSGDAAAGGLEVRFQMERLGVNRPVPAAEVRDMLRSLERAPPDSPVRKQLESVRLEIVTGDVRLPVDLQQMSELRRLLRDDHLPSRLVALDRESPVVPGEDFIDPTYTYMLLFIVVIVALWFGCSNAAKEIVKEESIYSRERAVNLGIFPYLASKFTLLSLITFFQAVMLLGLVFGALEAMHQWNPELQAPPRALYVGFPAMVGVMAVLSMTGVALGLLLSAAVSSTDRANTLLPYVLIPQIILGGGTLPVKAGVLYLLAIVFSPAYWAFRGVRLGSNDLPEYVGYRTEYIESAWLACGMLAVQMAVLLAATVICMRAKDIRRT